MRYYDIKIFPPGTTSASGTPQKEYTSHPLVNGALTPDPGALNITLDTYTVASAVPRGQTAIQIDGVSIADLSQANNLTNCAVFVYAGFQKGLPLNDPSQAGLILFGTIRQSFGNWVGVSMSLDLVIVGAGSVAAQDTNISFLWNDGTPLATALATTLTTAFPGVAQNIQISPNLVLTHTETGNYQSLPAFAQYIKAFTASVIGGTYQGVDIVMAPGGINVFDGTTTQPTPTQIAFTDLIGQPIWIQSATIQLCCPMRADLTVGSFITMPRGLLGSSGAGAPGAVTTTSASQPQARQSSIFSGTFKVVSVHHMGIFRQPDGMAWVTVIEAIQQLIPIPEGHQYVESLTFAP